jgi:hypothetical protein
MAGFAVRIFHKHDNMALYFVFRMIKVSPQDSYWSIMPLGCSLSKYFRFVFKIIGNVFGDKVATR